MREKTKPLNDPFAEAVPSRGFGVLDGVFLLIACGFFLAVLVASLSG